MPSTASSDGPRHATQTADGLRKSARGIGGGDPLVAADFDFRTPTKPTCFYVVASTPRSGSTYLCRELWSTGLMGAPLEYFNARAQLLQMAARLQPTHLGQYFNQLLSLRTSPNGVFGFKAHWNQFQLVVDSGSLPLFSRLRFIYIERRDRLAQAVSYAKAEQTRQFVAGASPRRAPVYDYRQIRFRLRRLDRDIKEWRALFNRNRVEPIEVAYESLVESPQAVTDDILRHFGFTRDPALQLKLPPVERQADAVNQEWIERFRRESSDTAERRKLPIDAPRSSVEGL